MPLQDAEVATAARAASEAILLAVDEDSTNEVVGELLRGLEDDAAGCRTAAAALVGRYFKSAQVDLEEHVPVILGAAWMLCALVCAAAPEGSCPRHQEHLSCSWWIPTRQRCMRRGLRLVTSPLSCPRTTCTCTRGV